MTLKGGAQWVKIFWRFSLITAKRFDVERRNSSVFLRSQARPILMVLGPKRKYMGANSPVFQTFPLFVNSAMFPNIRPVIIASPNDVFRYCALNSCKNAENENLTSRRNSIFLPKRWRAACDGHQTWTADRECSYFFQSGNFFGSS